MAQSDLPNIVCRLRQLIQKYNHIPLLHLNSQMAHRIESEIREWNGHYKSVTGRDYANADFIV